MAEEVVDSQLMLSRVVTALERQHSTQHSSVDPLPTVNGDAGLIRQVRVNILTNAMRFTGALAEPRIQVSVIVIPSEGAQMAEFVSPTVGAD